MLCSRPHWGSLTAFPQAQTKIYHYNTGDDGMGMYCGKKKSMQYEVEVALTLSIMQQEGHPACKTLVGCWRGYVSGSRCRFVCAPPDATATHYLLLQ